MSAKMRTPLSALVVLLGAVGAWLLAAGRREVQPRPPEILPPVVTVVSARPQEVQLRVRAHGTTTTTHSPVRAAWSNDLVRASMPDWTDIPMT